MGLVSALSTALTGLTAAETQIDVVGNNLANSQTVGFKESQVSFTTQFLQTLGLGSGPTATSGGTNPRQTGLGTQVAEISPNFSQGTIQTTSQASDVALQGDGFFMVEGPTGETMYTRSGIFRTNSENNLVTVNGQRLLGYSIDDEFQLQTTGLQPLTIPVGSVRVAQPTRNVVMEGILPPNGDIATTAEVIDSAILGDASIPRPDTSGLSIAAADIPDTTLTSLVSTDGGGTHAEGVTYRYRLAFVDNNAQTSESPSSDEIAVTVAAGNGAADNTISLNDLPGGAGNYSQMRIYRTEPDGNDFYLLDTVNVAGAPVNYVDDNSQTLDLTSPLDQTVISGNYSYLVTFAKSGAGETRPSPLIGPVNVANGRIQLSNLPTPPIPGPGDSFPAYDKVRIYRTTAVDSSTHYFVDEINVGGAYTDGKSDAEIMTNSQIDLDGPRVSPNTLLLDVVRRDGLNFEQLFREGTLDFTGRKGGRQLQTQSLDITPTSTVQELLDFIRASVGIQTSSDDPSSPIPGSENTIIGDNSTLSPGAVLTPDGRLRVISNNGTQAAVSISQSAFTLTDTTGDLSAPTFGFGVTQEGVGRSAVSDFVVYDSLGLPLNVRITAVMESRSGTSTVYRWFADSPDNDPLSGIDVTVGTGLLSFDGLGNFVSASNTEVTIDRRNVPSSSPVIFDLDFEGISGLESDDTALAAARQDGSAAGTLANFAIGEDGRIRGTFTNGVTRTLGQIRLARFSNPVGLEQRGQNLFAQGANSGLPIEANPGSNGTGSLVAGAVELSNADVGGNLIDLVLATTQYRGNTRVISTAQQLIDELLNLRR